MCKGGCQKSPISDWGIVQWMLRFRRKPMRIRCCLPQQSLRQPVRLTPPFTQGRLWCGAYRNIKLQFEAAEPNRAIMLDDCRITSHELPAGASRQTAIYNNNPLFRFGTGDICYLPSPKKKSASMPGPTWEPVTGSWGQKISSLGFATAQILSASARASSSQSPWEMATV